MRHPQVLWPAVLALVALGVLFPLPASGQVTGDADDNGFVDPRDHVAFAECLALSGPGVPGTGDCLDAFDFNMDGVIDLLDWGRFQSLQGHLPIPLRDITGAVITLDSDRPYHGPQTCGACHDIERIANGFIHQQGRTDPSGTIVMHDDYFGDGRWWVRSAGMYGRWSGGGGGLNRQMAGQDNAGPEAMDMTAFYWAFNCGGCHAGGGGVAFDRAALPLWNELTGEFGYEVLGKTAEDVVLDGDYAFVDDDGTLQPAPWDVTGVSAPECLHCHRSTRLGTNTFDQHRAWRAEVLATTTRLVDSEERPVQAFAAAGTAGQGWFSMLDTASDPPILQIDYGVGVDDGSLVDSGAGGLALARGFLAAPPVDRTCWGCHLPGGFQNKRGTVWFDTQDVHYRRFTERHDDDSGNDIADAAATACNTCHPGSIDHDFAKGDSPYAQFRNELDWVGFRSCRECHLEDSPVRHPDAPEVPGNVLVHVAGGEDTGPMEVLSCQACHVPHALERAVLVTDWSLNGDGVQYFSDVFLSADPLDPTDPDKSRWYPELRFKEDSDGVSRLFPQKREVSIFWADWSRAGTPDDFSDDTVQPIIRRRLRQAIGSKPLRVATDDNGDGLQEINRIAEILAYIAFLRESTDAHGVVLAENPVLIKGEQLWYADPESRSGLSALDIEKSRLAVTGYEIFGLDHNVLTADNAWGYNSNPETGCDQCHFASPPGSDVFDRQVLVDPWGPDGAPMYRTIREMTGAGPP